MEQIICIIAANTQRQFFFVITTKLSTSCLTENFQLNFIPNNKMPLANTSTVAEFKFFKMAERSDVCRDEALLATCARTKRLDDD